MTGILVFRSAAILKSQRHFGIIQLQGFTDPVYGDFNPKSENILMVRMGKKTNIGTDAGGVYKHKRRCERRAQAQP